MIRRYKPRKVYIFDWSPDIAYAIGLITTDGCLSSDNKTISFTSSDIELIGIIKFILNSPGKICFTRNIRSEAYRINICNVQMYDWLISIGLTKRKSLTVGQIAIPDIFFIDFLRGHLDGDGSITTYIDKSNMDINSKYIYHRLNVRFISASKKHMEWLQQKIIYNIGVSGRLHKTKENHLGNSMYILKFGKKQSLELLDKLYYGDTIPSLSRKRSVYNNFLISESKDRHYPASNFSSKLNTQ